MAVNKYVISAVETKVINRAAARPLSDGAGWIWDVLLLLLPLVSWCCLKPHAWGARRWCGGWGWVGGDAEQLRGSKRPRRKKWSCPGPILTFCSTQHCKPHVSAEKSALNKTSKPWALQKQKNKRSVSNCTLLYWICLDSESVRRVEMFTVKHQKCSLLFSFAHLHKCSLSFFFIAMDGYVDGLDFLNFSCVIWCPREV